MSTQIERIELLEKQLKELVKQLKPDDLELTRVRRTLCDAFVLLFDSSEDDDDSRVERLWRSCFIKRIDDFRKRVAASPQDRKLLGEFRSYLGESLRYFEETLSRRVKNKSLLRVYCCLGDLARYRELVSDGQDKRWTESVEWYRKACQGHAQSGLPHNQLAVIATYQKRELIALYQYERAIACSRPFEAAKKNLFQTLETAKAWIDASGPTESIRDVCINSFCRLHATTLLPSSNDAEDLAKAEADLAVINRNLLELLRKNSIRKEIKNALVCMSVFAVTNSINVGNATAMKDLGKRALDSIACAMITHATESAHTEDGKFLLFPYLFSEFFTRHTDLLSVEVKRRFEILDSSWSEISPGPTVRQPKTVEEDEIEFVGFLPLDFTSKSNADVAVRIVPDSERRRRFIHEFVREYLYRAINPYAAGGEVHFKEKIVKGSSAEEDDEEEILFRPVFATKKAPPIFPNQKISAAALPPQQGQFKFAPAPPGYGLWGYAPPPQSNRGLSFFGNPGSSYENVNWQASPVAANQVQDPFSWVASNFGAAPSPPSVSHPSSSQDRKISPPPGFR